MIEVWITRMNIPLTDFQYHNLISEVSSDKQKRLSKYHNLIDAHCSLLGDISARTLISKHLNICNHEIVLQQNPYGKPILKNNDCFHFNISHSGEYIACAVSNQPIGIDIECMKPVDLSLAYRFFTEEEIQYIFSDDSISHQQKRFYTIWTRKESYIKLIGQGLHIPLNSFEVLKPQANLFYQCIHQDNSVMCHICIENEEKVFLKHLSVESLIESYFFYQTLF